MSEILKPEDVKVFEFIPKQGITPALFSYQMEFMDILISKNKLLAVPIDFSKKSVQAFMKVNIAAHVEEIMEMHQIYEEMVMGGPGEVLIKEFNLEQADALHFWLELFIYMGIDPDDLKQYYLSLGVDKGIPFNPNDDPLEMSLRYAQYLQNEDRELKLDYLKRVAFRVSTRDNTDLTHAGLGAGTEIYKASESYLFKVTYYLYLATGLLKGKYWREEEVGVNQEKLEEYVMAAWLYYTMYLNLHNFTAEGMFHTYYRKNRVNIDRQINGY